jgi:hypothetical protein
MKVNEDVCTIKVIEEMFNKILSSEPGIIGSDNMTCIVAKFVK